MTLCKSNESAIQWFYIHDRITFATILNQTVYLSSARVTISPVVVPRLIAYFRWPASSLLCNNI